LAAFGSTLVATFQIGRFFGGGSTDIGFATSTNGGVSWTNGSLSGITVFAGGAYNAVSDPAVAYDRAHAVWLINSLAIVQTSTVVVSRSPDGLHWGIPIVISNSPDADKNWIACDNGQASPFFGHCYVEWDDPSQKGLIWMSTSTDGGLTWSPPANTRDMATGVGGQPVVQPNGTVIVPIQDGSGTHVIAFSSQDGGANWSSAATVADIGDHLVAGGLRTDALPSATVDAVGEIYVVWHDCRFRTGCSSNDVVLSKSSDGITWTAPVRIPLDDVSSTVDHFIPAIASDPATSGASAHLAILYYYYPTAACDETSCALNVGYTNSRDGGNTWSAPSLLVGPMSIDWLANTKTGRMVGDYFAVAYSNSNAFPVFTVARANNGTQFDEAIYTTSEPLVQAAVGVSSQSEQPRGEVKSDHGPRRFYDLEHRYPVKPKIQPN